MIHSLDGKTLVPHTPDQIKLAVKAAVHLSIHQVVCPILWEQIRFSKINYYRHSKTRIKLKKWIWYKTACKADTPWTLITVAGIYPLSFSIRIIRSLNMTHLWRITILFSVEITEVGMVLINILYNNNKRILQSISSLRVWN